MNERRTTQHFTGLDGQPMRLDATETDYANGVRRQAVEVMIDFDALRAHYEANTPRWLRLWRIVLRELRTREMKW